MHDLLFIIDCALAAHSEKHLQEFVDSFPIAFKKSNITISIKIEVMYNVAPTKPCIEANLLFNSEKLNAAENFTYPGSCFSVSCNTDKDRSNSIAEASVSYGKLH